MVDIHVEIVGGDYIKTGVGSKTIKEILRTMGVDPTIIRKAVVAAYEAEMNVAIHAYRGELRATIAPDILEVIIADEGPGIPDIEQAMREGFSTAPPEARELGFGAGMGLPNIRRNTDKLTLDSVPGKGTTLRFSLFLQPDAAELFEARGITIAKGNCIRCLRCVQACPTQAIRIRPGGPEILKHLCIECTECMAACPAHVFDIDCSDTSSTLEGYTAVFPTSLWGQFGTSLSQDHVATACSSLGCADVAVSSWAEATLLEAIGTRRSDSSPSSPLFAPVCPAVLHLIQLRYPSLLQYVAPFLGPMELFLETLVDTPTAYVPVCPAQAALIYRPGTTRKVIKVHPRIIVKMLFPLLHKKAESAPHITAGSPEPSQPLTITGMKQVCQFLDASERGQINEYGIIALYACEEMCHGSPVWDTPPVISKLRTEHWIPSSPVGGKPLRPLYRLKPLRPRAGMRLAEDMPTALKKLSEINKTKKALPGRDCAVCGAPSCLAFAEDVVMGRADINGCIFRGQNDSAASESV